MSFSIRFDKFSQEGPLYLLGGHRLYLKKCISISKYRFYHYIANSTDPDSELAQNNQKAFI